MSSPQNSQCIHNDDWPHNRDASAPNSTPRKRREQPQWAPAGVQLPDVLMLARSQVSAHVQQLIASGDKMGAIKAWRVEANVDLPTPSRCIESL